MKAALYLATQPTFGVGAHPPFPSGYKQVAELEVQAANPMHALEEVFRCTNSIDTAWVQNDEVLNISESAELRSTSVGDVVRLENGTYWRCEMTGWKQITAAGGPAENAPLMATGDIVVDLTGDLGTGQILDRYTNNNMPGGPCSMFIVEFSEDQVADRLPTELRLATAEEVLDHSQA